MNMPAASADVLTKQRGETIINTTLQLYAGLKLRRTEQGRIWDGEVEWALGNGHPSLSQTYVLQAHFKWRPMGKTHSCEYICYIQKIEVQISKR